MREINKAKKVYFDKSGNKIRKVSPCKAMLDIKDWEGDDKRIHEKANCKYRDNRTYLDVIYDLIKADLVESVFVIKCEQGIENK